MVYDSVVTCEVKSLTAVEHLRYIWPGDVVVVDVVLLDDEDVLAVLVVVVVVVEDDVDVVAIISKAPNDGLMCTLCYIVRQRPSMNSVHCCPSSYDWL